MATGFMGESRMDCSKNVSLFIMATLALFAPPGFAADVALVGLIGAKAIVVIDGGAPRTLAPGQKTAEGVTLLGTEKDAASFDIGGKKRVLRMGGRPYSAASPGKQSVTLNADTRGHFVAAGSINGGSVRFLVDTGATFVALPAAEAKRLGIDYLHGERGRMQTANGVATAYRVKLDTVRIGEVEINNVDAVVSENDALGVALLGMSFLNRMEMKRDGQSMTLTKRF
jgi:aspartyl protease family protein